MKVEYSSNNSGGHWWLTDEDWYALEKAGWKVRWAASDEFQSTYLGNDGKYMGALATYATLPECASLREAAQSWERATKKSSTDAGCPCCGQPHNFTLYDDEGHYVTSGPETSYSASW